jgi:hypothetical protein
VLGEPLDVCSITPMTEFCRDLVTGVFLRFALVLPLAFCRIAITPPNQSAARWHGCLALRRACAAYSSSAAPLESVSQIRCLAAQSADFAPHHRGSVTAANAGSQALAPVAASSSRW